MRQDLCETQIRKLGRDDVVRRKLHGLEDRRTTPPVALDPPAVDEALSHEVIPSGPHVGQADSRRGELGISARHDAELGDGLPADRELDNQTVLRELTMRLDELRDQQAQIQRLLAAVAPQ